MLRIFFGIAFCAQAVIGLSVLTVGDWGDNSANGMIRQERVAVAMSNWCGEHHCDFIFSMGDNFYNDGVVSAVDPRFNTSWRNVYDKPHIANMQWHQSLGNHDYSARTSNNELHQIEFGYTEPRWNLPWLWYEFQITENGMSVHFVVVDAMSIIFQKYDWQEQLRWYDQTLAESTADWLIVVVHHPPYACGGYAPGIMDMRNTVVEPAERHQVDLMISGHDHNLQHITKQGANYDVDYVISGGGGRGLYAFSASGNSTLIQSGFEVKHFAFTNGFIMLEIEPQQIVHDFIDTEGDIVYSFSRQRRATRRRKSNE